MGTHSNFIQTHFWNAQDENLKVAAASSGEGNSHQEQVVKESTHVIYHETRSSG